MSVLPLLIALLAAPARAAEPAPAQATASSGDAGVRLSVASDPLSAAPGGAAARTLTLSATGTQATTVLEIALQPDDGAFRLSGRYPPFTLSPGQFEALKLVFVPAADGAYATTIRVNTSAGVVESQVSGTADATAPERPLVVAATGDAGGLPNGVGGLIGAKGGGAWGDGGTAVAQASDQVVVGKMDKDVIDAVVKRNMNQVRYCYQRELTKVPTLEGKIVVKFVIANDGTVSSAVTKSSTMASPAVEACLNGRFMHMQFPAPSGGGIVVVSYPFTFSPGA